MQIWLSNSRAKNAFECILLPPLVSNKYWALFCLNDHVNFRFIHPKSNRKIIFKNARNQTNFKRCLFFALHFLQITKFEHWQYYLRPYFLRKPTRRSFMTLLKSFWIWIIFEIFSHLAKVKSWFPNFVYVSEWFN